MVRRILAFAVTAVVFSLGSLQADDRDPKTWASLFQPLPKVAEDSGDSLTPQKIALGKKLFNESRLSLAGQISCNTCHGLSTYGVDGEATSLGHKKQRGNRNAPTVYNSALHFTQFWDGRAKDVEEQALGPIMNPVEMAMGAEGDVEKILKAEPQYVAAFSQAFPGEKDPINFKNVGRAIGAFERTLITPSRFDDFLRGDGKALNDSEVKGLALFRDAGCVTCHSGVAVGGQMYQKIGLAKPYETSDLGRYDVTKNEGDKYFFKVPSLRNIEHTGPYFHDGAIRTLDQAVTLMGRHQLGRELAPEQVTLVITFLKALSAPKEALAMD